MEWETPSFFWEKGQSEMTMEERIIIKKYFLSSFQISLFFDIFIHEYNAFWSYPTLTCSLLPLPTPPTPFYPSHYCVFCFCHPPSLSRAACMAWMRSKRPTNVYTTEDSESLYPLSHQLPIAPKEGSQELLSAVSSWVQWLCHAWK